MTSPASKRDTAYRAAKWLLKELGIEHPSNRRGPVRRLTADQEQVVLDALSRGESFADVDRRFGFKSGFAWHIAQRAGRDVRKAKRPTLQLKRAEIAAS